MSEIPEFNHIEICFVRDPRWLEEREKKGSS